MSKRKKPAKPQPNTALEAVEAATDVATTAEPDAQIAETTEVGEVVPAEADELVAQAPTTTKSSERAILAALRSEASQTELEDVEATVNVVGERPFPGRDDLDAPTLTMEGETLGEVDGIVDQRRHLRGLLEALIFASDSPIKPNELAKLADAPVKQVKDLLPEIRQEFSSRGIHLEELAGGWVFRTSALYAPFIRDLTKQRPVRLTRAQVETLAIIAYRQPITRPEIDDVRGVDSGPVLKLLLERDLVRILGKRDEVGRPLIYGTTTHFLEFFGLKSLKDLPTLREFTELTDESRDAYEAEMGEPPNDAPPLDSDDDADGTDHPGQEASALDDQGEESDDDRDHDAHESMAVPAGSSEDEDEPPSSSTNVMMNSVDDESASDGSAPEE